MAKRKSSIDLLPKEIKETIEGLYKEGYTLDDILSHLNRLFKDQDLPSRSALHRHTQKLDRIGDKILKTRALAETFVDKLGKAPESKVARMNIEMMHSVLTDIALQADQDGEVTLNPEETYFLSRSLEALAKAEKIGMDAIIQDKEQALKAAAKVVSQEAKEAGLSAKAAAQIRAKILGIK